MCGTRLTLHDRAKGVIFQGIYAQIAIRSRLIEWVISMDWCGVAPRPSTVGKMAKILLAARETIPSTTVCVNWRIILLSAGMSFVHAFREDTIFNVPETKTQNC